MFDIFHQLNISPTGWAFALFGSFLLGVAKGGIKGLGAIISIITALVFGSRASTGIIMPLLIVGDTFAVIYYNRHARWHYLWKLMPWVVIGVLIGVWYGKDLPEEQFKIGMAVIILASAGFMFLTEHKRSYHIPDNRFFAAVMGSLAGFTTMVGNLAGPFSELYFLAIRVPKEIFIGTAAWLFFLTNIIKLPFHIWSWKTINIHSLYVDLMLLPSLLLGLWVGIRIVKTIHQQHFRLVIIILSAIGALLIVLQQ
ncbi:MAG: sulfite exporter TauE/SafE family protein [Saprospiraceae bacterium]